MSDLVLNVKQLSNYPAKTNATGTENLLVQAGLGAPYQSITSGALVATALNDAGSMGIGYGMPNTPPPTSGQLFASNFIAPINGGFQFNTYLDAQGILRYWNTGAAADWAYDQNAGFIWRRFPDGAAGQQITFPAPLMALSQSGHLTLYFDTITVVRDPAAPFEVATANWVRNNTVQTFNNRTGPITLTSQDVYTALQITSPIATQDYAYTVAQQSIQNLLLTCPLVNSFNGRSGQVYLNLSDITCVFFQSGQQPISPTPPQNSDDNSIATTEWVTQHVGLSVGGGAIIANTPPAAPFPGELWFDSVGVQLYVWYDDGTSQQWVIANNSGGGGGTGGGGSGLLISASPPLAPTLGTLWWNTIDGNSYVYYDDGTSQQWVPATSTAGVVGGPFLPTAGGTVTGNVTISGSGAATPLHVSYTSTFSGAWAQGFYTSFSGSGTSSNTGQPMWNLFNTVDSVQATAANSVANVANYYTCSSTLGARIAQQVSLTISNTNDAAGNQAFHQAISAGITADGTLGGTSTTYGGSIFGANITSVATGNGKYLNGIAGLEVDVALRAGSSATFKGAISAVLQGNDAVESTYPSIAFGIGLNGDSPASHGFGRGICFGSPGGWWPMNTTSGIMIYADPNHLAGGPAYQCASGIDFSAVTFSGNFLKSANFTVDGAGNLTCDNVTAAAGSFTSVTASGTTALQAMQAAGTAIFYAGLNFGNQVGANNTDLSKHITLYTGYGFAITGGRINYVAPGTAVHVFNTNAADQATIGQAGVISATAVGVGGASGPTWTTGTVAPASTQPVGSLYSRVGGAVGATLYVSRGAGTWAAVAGV